MVNQHRRVLIKTGPTYYIGLSAQYINPPRVRNKPYRGGSLCIFTGPLYSESSSSLIFPQIRLRSYCAIASPHLGARKPESHWTHSVWNTMSRASAFLSVTQLTLHDGPPLPDAAETPEDSRQSRAQVEKTETRHASLWSQRQHPLENSPERPGPEGSRKSFLEDSADRVSSGPSGGEGAARGEDSQPLLYRMACEPVYLKPLQACYRWMLYADVANDWVGLFYVVGCSCYPGTRGGTKNCKR